MAIARLSVKVGKAGKAAPHADYIAREGAYAGRLERGEVLEAKESGNMPGWAEDHPGRFWHAADAFERANGTTYRELELALPRELVAEDRAALVREFVAQELGERHPYTWSIHRPKAADGQDQPHAHLMFSERRLDGIDRDPDQFFKRWNAKAPEKGGAHKRFGEVEGPNRSQSQRAADLRALRGRWGSLVNEHLDRAGLDERIDMRSLKAQGIDRPAERKQSPGAWRDPEQRATVLEFRQSNRDRDQAAADFRAVVPAGAVSALKEQHDRLEAIRAEMAAQQQERMAKLFAERDANTARLEAKRAAEDGERERQRAEREAAWAAGQPAREAAERERVAQVEAANRLELDRRAQERAERFEASLATRAAARSALETPAPAVRDQAPAAAPVQEVAKATEPPAAAKAPPAVPRETPAQLQERKALEAIDRGPPGTAEKLYAKAIEQLQQRDQAAAAKAIEALRIERRQWQDAIRVHQEAEPRVFGKAKWKEEGAALDRAGEDLAKREGAAARSAHPKTTEASAKAQLAAAMPKLVERADAERQAREARELERQRQAHAAKLEALEKAKVGKEFNSMAMSREMRGFGYTDRSEKWQGMPAELRDKIEDYNRIPKAQRPAALEKINADPRTAELLKEYRELSRSKTRGGRGD